MSKALQHRKRHSVTTQNRIPTIAGCFVSPGGGGGLEDFARFTMIKLCKILILNP